MNTLKNCLLALLCPVMHALAQSPIQKTQALTIGDTVPAISLGKFINLTASNARLADFKGKIVILDFWGSYCGPCIELLSTLDSLQKIFNHDLQVIAISDFPKEEDLSKGLKRILGARELKYPVVSANETLSQYFPHMLVSHLVWIDTAGIVKAITGADYVTNANIQLLVDGKAIHWPVKKDVLDFDYKKPLLAIAQPADVNPAFVYYSTLTGFIDGISPPNGTQRDSMNHVSTTSFYNYDLLTLSQIAIDYRVGANQNQFVLHVKDRSRYITNSQVYYSDWVKKNNYCYSLRLPLGLSEKEIEQAVKKDLQHWLGILGIQVKKQKPVKGNAITEKYIITEM